MGLPTSGLPERLVHFEADEVIRRWREFGSGRDVIDIPYEQLARETEEHGRYHMRGVNHAANVAAELRHRAYVAAYDRAVVYIHSRLNDPWDP